MTVVIYHYNRCGTSRNALAMIEAAGVTPVVIDYIETGWTRAQLLGLLAAADITPREILREKDIPDGLPDLLEPNVTDDDLLEAMVAHPILVNRPIVCSPKGVRLCRPKERVLELLG